jgi:protein tyrosine/serine phosphatase
VRVFLLLLVGIAAVSPNYPATVPSYPAAQADGTAAPATAASAPVFAEKLKLPGLSNLGRVTEGLYRGGKPQKQGYDQLQGMKIDIVVDMNTSSKDIQHGKTETESRGMRYISMPWSPVSLPTDDQVTEFLRLIRENPDKRIFVHCERGADRTGLMMAVFRMAGQGWTPEQALAEMERFKFHGLWYRQMKRYIREFPAKLKASPALAGG